jgi:hypothetical protein
VRTQDSQIPKYSRYETFLPRQNQLLYSINPHHYSAPLAQKAAATVLAAVLAAVLAVVLVAVLAASLVAVLLAVLAAMLLVVLVLAGDGYQ